jgi:hypothetical protein
MEKRKLESDHKLIKILFNVEPLDWNRRDTGELVFLDQDSRKFVYSPEQLSALQDKALVEKDHSIPLDRIDDLVPKAKAILEDNQKPRSHHKKA